MSDGNWWDPVVDFFTGGDSGGAMTGTTENLGKLADDTSLADLPTDTGSLISNGTEAAAAGLDLGTLTKPGENALGGYGLPDDTYTQLPSGKPGENALGGYGLPDATPDSSAGLAVGTATGKPGENALGGYGLPPTTAPSTSISDLTNGITGGLKKAGSYLEAHPSLVNAGLNLINKSSVKTGTPPAYQQAAAVQTTGNESAKNIAEKKTAVGDSLVNQAPFLANNALAGSMNQNAANEAALQRSLTQQGYKAGDAQYDSAMAQHRTAASQNNGTAWAQGQGQMAGQEATGAGLYTAYTPNTSALDKLGDAQYKSQQDENTATTDGTALAQQMFNIYSGGDTATKTPTIKNATDGTKP